MVFRLPITLPPVVRDLVPGVVSGPDAEAAGRRVLVTGASGTFGRAIAADLAGRGARVVGLDLAPRPDDVVEVIACDITDDASVASAVARAVKMLGGLDILARPAGLGLRAAAGRPRRDPRDLVLAGHPVVVHADVDRNAHKFAPILMTFKEMHAEPAG